MAIISNGVTVISNGAGSAPTTAQVASATASISVGAVGSYALCFWSNGNSTSFGTTVSGVGYCDCSGGQSGSTSGTWRQMGARNAGNSEQKATVFLRIS
jgi:hypothetical protein